MRLYHNTQVSQQHTCIQNTREWMTRWMVPPRKVIESKQEGGDIIKARKLPNPVLASHQHTSLHRELLFCHRRGVLPKRKSELQCVLEHREREQHRQRKLALCPLCDLEVKLRTRRQRLQAYELEEEKGERQETVPEFVRMRGTLRRTQTFS